MRFLPGIMLAIKLLHVLEIKKCSFLYDSLIYTFNIILKNESFQPHPKIKVFAVVYKNRINIKAANHNWEYSEYYLKWKLQSNFVQIGQSAEFPENWWLLFRFQDDFPPNLGVDIAILFQLRMMIRAKEKKVLGCDFFFF